MLSHTTYLNPQSTQWVTFVHGAGGSSAIWFRQIKAFHTHFNVLLVDLRGHGNSEKNINNSNYTFKDVADDIIEVMNHLTIKQSHLIGISLGSIIIRQLADTHPERIASLIMAGAIMKLNIRSQILMRVGIVSKSIIPYLILYQFFAYIIMPRRNHKKSRTLFINEAKKLNQQEFIRWFKLASEVNPLLKYFRNTPLTLPSLYVMGSQDAMFLPSIKKLVNKYPKTCALAIAPNCGHVVNIDQPDYFNKKAIAFIKHIGN